MNILKTTVLALGLFATVPLWGQDEPPETLGNLPPSSDEAEAGPTSESEASASRTGMSARAFIGSTLFDLKGSYDMESDSVLSYGVEGNYSFSNGTWLHLLGAFGEGTWVDYSDEFTHYDFSVDWLQRVSANEDGFLNMGIGFRAHGLGPKEDVLWNHYGGHDMKTFLVKFEPGFSFKTDWEVTVTWGMGAFTFGTFAVDKEMLQLEDGFEQTFAGRLAYAPLAARYAIDLYLSGEDGAYQLENDAVIKAWGTEIGLGFAYKF